MVPYLSLMRVFILFVVLLFSPRKLNCFVWCVFVVLLFVILFFSFFDSFLFMCISTTDCMYKVPTNILYNTTSPVRVLGTVIVITFL